MSHKTFTSTDRPTETISFDIDGETFTARPLISAGYLLNLLKTVRAGRATEAYFEMLEVALDDESNERLTARLYDKERPLALDLVMAAADWLAGEYLARPTQPASSSPNGHSDAGQSSTESSQPAE